jgi:adenosylmethionine-8-amino-7-oxononanoate aminotransferase
LTHGLVDSTTTRVLSPELDRPYPVVVRGEGVWVEDADGTRYLDAMSGGSMALTLGHGRRDIIEAAREQAGRISCLHNERLTSPPQEHLAHELVSLAPEGIDRVHFVTGGAEANEAALRLARAYHVERGEPERWRIVSPAQAYHGCTVATLSLTGRPGLWGHYEPYLSDNLHVPPSTDRFDPTGAATLEELDRVIEEAGPETISVYFSEVIGAAALPAHKPPELYWEGLAERREKHGFLIAFDEVVTGLGRTGEWFASSKLPFVPDMVATAKGLGAGYTAIGAMLCHEHVYEAVAAGSRSFALGHTWNGAPLPCAVGAKVLSVLQSEGWVDHVRRRGPQLREQLEEALSGVAMVREVRGHGYLLGVDYRDPRDGSSFLAPELRVAARVDDACMDNHLITLSTQPTRDGYAGDQSLFAPSFTASDEELAEMVDRFAASVTEVARQVEAELE